MTDQEDRDLLAQLLRPSAELSSTPDAADRLIRHGRRLVRRRRWATVSGGLALIVTVALIVGAAGLLRDASAGHTPTVTPVSPHVVSPVGGLVLGVDQQRRFILEDLADPGRARSVEIGAGATGQVLTGAITANPGAGWVVAYAPARTPVQPATPTRLAIVDPSGAVHPFGPPVPAEISVGGLAVSPDGSRIALALISVSGAEPAAIQVLPMPGHTGQSRRWTIANRYDNDLNSLSWAPDSRRLTYITGTSTGAGMAGNPSTLDTSLPGSTAPATGASASKQGCAVFSGAWLGTTGRFGAIVECPDSRTDRFVEMNPTTGVQQPTRPQLPIYGCNLHEIQSLADASRILINQCGSMYVLAGGHITKVTTGLVDAVWAGNITGGVDANIDPVGAGHSDPHHHNYLAGQVLPTTIRAVLEAPSPTQYDQPTLQPGAVWTGRTFTAKVPDGSSVMALSCGCGSSNQDPDPWGNYPLLNTDGHTWRVDGPEFGHGGSGHGASLVDNLLSLPGGGQLAWGRGANYLYVTHDLGAHWYTALFPPSYDAVTVTGNQLTLSVDDQQAGQPPVTYTSGDGGLTWTLNQ